MRMYDLKKMQLRDIIDARLREMGVSRYVLAKALDGKLSHTTIFRFLNGESETKADAMELMLKACGLILVSDGTVPRWATNPKGRGRPRNRGQGSSSPRRILAQIR